MAVTAPIIVAAENGNEQRVDQRQPRFLLLGLRLDVAVPAGGCRTRDAAQVWMRRSSIKNQPKQKPEQRLAIWI